MVKDSGSVRHHYIPQFYIKNFANTDGRIFVFNKDKIDTHLKFKIPISSLVTEEQSKSFGYIENDNTVFDHNKERMGDWYEQLYGALDNTFAKLFLKMKNFTSSEFPLSNEETHWFYFHMLLLFYRSPPNRILIDKLRDKRPIEEDYIFASEDPKKQKELLKNFSKGREFKKLEYSTLPYILFLKYFSFEGLGLYKEILNNFDLKRLNRLPENIKNFTFLASDNPIIVLNMFENYGLFNEFFFPISPNTILFKVLPTGIMSLQSLNALIIHRSHKYIFSSKKEWLIESINNYLDIKKSIIFPSESDVEDYLIKLLKFGMQL